jgi:thioredoxin-related protein
MKNTITFFITLLFGFYTQAQQPDAEGSLVKWMSLEEAMKKVETAPRPVLIDFYTDWCGWCKRMMQTTYANPGLAQYINNNFYAVKFDAEGKDTITYLGQKYAPTGTAPRSTHALAAKLLQNKLMYPTTLFLNNFEKEKNEFRYSMLAGGYLDEKKIEPMLVFMLENAFRNASFDDFNAQFQLAFLDTLAEKKYKKLNWLSPVEAFKTTTTKKKKTIVLIGTDWCNTCKIEQRSSFINDTTSSYINEHFDLVYFNPELKEDITFKGQVFKNAQQGSFPFHQLSLALTNNNFVLPTTVILDEDMNPIDAVPYFMTQTFLGDVAKYYGDNIHKTKSWNDFQKAKQKP